MFASLRHKAAQGSPASPFAPRIMTSGPSLLSRVGHNVHLAGHLRRDTWQGRDRVQILVDDAAG